MEKEKCFKAVVGQVKPAIKISMSSREAVTRDLRIFVSAGTVNERKEIRRCRTATFRHDRPCCMNGTKAFTLIELLVVVLIIGILAAVALPQYQKAVAKSRFTQNMISGNAVRAAVESYRLANGSWPSSLDELDVESKSYCAIWTNNLGTVGEHFVLFCESKAPGYRIQWYRNSMYRYCEVHKDNKIGNEVCKSVTGATSYGTISNDYLYAF